MLYLTLWNIWHLSIFNVQMMISLSPSRPYMSTRGSVSLQKNTQKTVEQTKIVYFVTNEKLNKTYHTKRVWGFNFHSIQYVMQLILFKKLNQFTHKFCKIVGFGASCIKQISSKMQNVLLTIWFLHRSSRELSLHRYTSGLSWSHYNSHLN